MKIALLIDSLTSAGAQRQMILLANGLSEMGHSIGLFVYHDNMQLLGELNIRDIELIKVLKRHKLDLGFAFRLISALRDFQPEVIISFLTGPNLWARLCGPYTSAKAIITSERNTNIVQSKTKLLLERLLQNRSTTIVVNTIAARNQLMQFAHIPESKIAVVYNGVDTQKFHRIAKNNRPTIRELYDLRYDDFVIILPARIERQKNHLCLIEAVARLNFQTHRVQVRFFGNENDLGVKQELVERIENLGLRNHVRFCGVSHNMPVIYNMADVIVLPSDWEGLPNVVLEAMACETPVIISDVADNRRLVIHGESGFLFNKNDSDQLAQRILHLIECMDNYRQKIGTAARSRIKLGFSIATYVDGFCNVIDEAVRKNLALSSKS